MKGQTGILGIMAGVVMVVTIAGFSMPVSQSLATEAGEPVTDIGSITKINAYTSNYAYNYLRQAARYSIHNKSYEIGQKGGEIEWNSEKVSQELEKTYRCGDDNPLQKINCQLQQEAAERTADYGWQRSNRCNTEMKDTELNMTEKSSVLNTTVQMDCEINDRSITRTKEEEINLSTSRVRMQTLTHTAYEYMGELDSSWDTVESEGSAMSCGSPGSETYREAEEDAANDADEELENNFESVSIPLPQGVKLESSIVDISEELDYGTDPSNFEEADQSFGVTKTGDCCERAECDEGPCPCEKYDHEVDAEVQPEESQIEITIEDDENKLVLKDGWQNLQFVVENYVHSFN